MASWAQWEMINGHQLRFWVTLNFGRFIPFGCPRPSYTRAASIIRPHSIFPIAPSCIKLDYLNVDLCLSFDFNRTPHHKEMDKLIKTGYLILIIWLCLSQLTANQRQYAVKRVQSRQSKDLKKVAQPNRHRSSNQPNGRSSHRNNPFQDFLSESSEMVLTNDEYNNDVVSNWNSNGGWKPPASGWQPPSNGWQQSNGWENGWNNGWWQQDPWKDPYTKLSLG